MVGIGVAFCQDSNSTRDLERDEIRDPKADLDRVLSLFEMYALWGCVRVGKKAH